ncbi:MBL fold metallo-hydrolase [Kineococcus rhizosphaerae]|uniref:L-ascorbate metabolism protein UlaG (Beta-lactamase superfamily) n=1 Tax=Kineococcus rhizosphaerae TaxID=559628 RepID=A0A2T0R9J6_9ACTN|nr:MBL fold metallo-hydrolase [Kineococcus rhizosphaerae]PRY17839.1 L-ascorbate metabolism protein UlaG (beta-lactamase superfamily) [Kineococcus rhizosphaerae]
MDSPDPVDADTLSLTFIGTATVLLRWGDLTLLTDPNFLHRGQFAYLGKGLVSRRLTDPALAVDRLPPLSGIVLSHLHGDHFDRVARRGLDHDVPVLTTRHAERRLVRRYGFEDVSGLRTWESRVLVAGGDQVRVTAAPGRHAPGLAQALLPPVMGSVLEFGPVGGPVRRRVYVSGDTLNVPELREVPHRFPDVDLAVLHLGGTTLPGGLVVTLDGVGGADLLELVRPRRAVPVHVDDYGVFRSPLGDFTAEVARRGLDSVVRVVARGETARF